MKYSTIIMLIGFLPAALAAQQQADSEPDDPFDLSSASQNVEEFGIPTASEVSELEARARDLFNTGDCGTAIPALQEYSRQANHLANLLAATLEPFYGASYDDRKSYASGNLGPLIRIEGIANDYRRKRNIAIAMQGECEMKAGNNKKALPLLTKALDLFSLKEEEWWFRTRDNVLELVGVE